MVVSPLLVTPRAASAEPARVRASETNGEHSVKLFNEARALYQRGKYRDAISKLEAALALDPGGAELVYNLALIHEKLGELDTAQHYFRAYLQMEDDPKLRAQVEATLKRLEGVKNDPRVARRAQTEPSSGDASKPAASSHPRPWVFVAAGSAVGAFAVGSAFGLSALATRPGRDVTTGGNVAYATLQDDAAAAHRLAIVADVSFAVAAVASAAALYLFLRPEDPSTTSIALTVSGARASIGVQF
jgi:tetratricopeptide (TPR) repeat protein